MGNKKKIIVVIAAIVGFGIAVNVTNLFFPISNNKAKSSVQICKEMNLIETKGENVYVTRIEFLEALMRTIGMTDTILDNCYSTSFEGTIATEVYYPEKLSYITKDEEILKKHEIYSAYSHGDKMVSREELKEISREVFSVIDRYELICRMASYSDCLQGYLTDYSNETRNRYCFEFRGTNDITVNEAVSMIQACLTDIEIDVDDSMFDKNSDTYKFLLYKARTDGILRWHDCAFWSFSDAKLSRENMAVLLSRLQSKKRYKYITEPIWGERDSWEIDNEHSMTYYEYLQNRYDQ